MGNLRTCRALITYLVFCCCCAAPLSGTSGMNRTFTQGAPKPNVGHGESQKVRGRHFEIQNKQPHTKEKNRYKRNRGRETAAIIEWLTSYPGPRGIVVASALRRFRRLRCRVSPAHCSRAVRGRQGGQRLCVRAIIWWPSSVLRRPSGGGQCRALLGRRDPRPRWRPRAGRPDGGPFLLGGRR